MLVKLSAASCTCETRLPPSIKVSSWQDDAASLAPPICHCEAVPVAVGGLLNQDTRPKQSIGTMRPHACHCKKASAGIEVGWRWGASNQLHMVAAVAGAVCYDVGQLPGSNHPSSLPPRAAVAKALRQHQPDHALTGQPLPKGCTRAAHKPSNNNDTTRVQRWERCHEQQPTHMHGFRDTCLRRVHPVHLATSRPYMNDPGPALLQQRHTLSCIQQHGSHQPTTPGMQRLQHALQPARSHKRTGRNLSPRCAHTHSWQGCCHDPRAYGNGITGSTPAQSS